MGTVLFFCQSALRKKRTVPIFFIFLSTRWQRIGCAWLVACLITGCAHLHPVATAPTAAAPSDTTAYYAYPHTPITPTVELLSEHEGYTVERVRWPLVPPPAGPTEGRSDISWSPTSTSDGLLRRPHAGGGMATTDGLEESERTIEVEWYESSQPGQRAALLVLPILGGNYPIERAFCRFFAYRGIHCALIHRRTMKFTTSASPTDLEALLRRAVIRNRQVCDWLETQPSVDAARLGVFGISMGGMLGVMTAAVEPRVKALVAGLAGGGIADVLCHTRDPILTRPRARYLAKQGLTLEELHRRLADGIRTDPLRLALYVDSRRVLMIMARLDRTIPTAERLALWRALGQPDTLRLPAGHYSSIVLVPVVINLPNQ